MNLNGGDPWQRGDRRNRWWIVAVVLPCYVWFFHGYNDVQTAHYVTMRSLVEAGTFQIDAFQNRTGDTSTYEGRVYSNKPPGLPVIGAIALAPLTAVEKHFGWSPDDPEVSRFNEYVMALWTGVPYGLATVLLLYGLFRRDGVSPDDATVLVTAFALGTLVLPYCGAISVHNLNAWAVVFPWALLTSANQTKWKDLLAGAVVGVGITTNYLMAPIGALFATFVLWERRDLSAAVRVCVGPVVAVALLMAFSAVHFGSPFATSNTYQSASMTEEGKLFGMFGWPEWRMIYWLTFHPFRGVFYYCPVLLIGLAGLLMRWRMLRQPRTLVPVLAVLYFFIANASFNGWTGGWFAGPRYLIPAMPMLFLFAPQAYARYRVLSWILIVISTFNMLAIASVRVVFPAPSFGPPPPLSDSFSNPVAECYRRWTFNQVARQVGSFNLGMWLRLTGLVTLVPIGLYELATFPVIAIRKRRSLHPVRV